MTRGRLTIAALAVLTVILSGCAAPTDPSWTPPAWTAPAVVVTSTPEPIDSAALPLDRQRLRNDTIGLQARYALLPGASAFNDTLTAGVWEAITARATQAQTPYQPAVFPPGSGLGDRGCVTGSTRRAAADILTDPQLGPPDGTGTALLCDIITAHGTYFGQSIRIVASEGTDTLTTLYTDTATGEVITPAQLWSADAAPALWDNIVDAVRRDHGSLSLAPVQPAEDAGLTLVRDALAHTLIAPDGSLVINLPPGFTAPELIALGVPATTDPLTIGISPATAAPLITPFAAGLTAAVSQARPYSGPAMVAAGHEVIDCRLVPCVALTYDDGPSEKTPGILDALAAAHGSATFFVIGQNARRNAETLNRALAEGHLVENHTWNHPHLPQIPPDQVAKQIRDTNAAVRAVTGTTPTVFRPPYGEYTPAVLAQAGMAAILWDVDTLDWRGPSDDELTRRAVDQPRPGSIVLQHDTQPNTARTAAAVYAGLADRGFTLVNLAQLFHGQLPASGAWRSGR